MPRSSKRRVEKASAATEPPPLRLETVASAAPLRPASTSSSLVLQIGEPRERPVRLLQFGEGNFLRCFIGWMVDLANDAGELDAGIAVAQPLPSGTIEILREQNGLYTVILKGVEKGELRTICRLITAVKETVNPYEQWRRFLDLAGVQTLRWFVSNTTEAGITYEACPFPGEACPPSFPAKLTAFLYERFRRFSGDANQGLLLLPCELNESNGDRLRELVQRHAVEWRLPEEFNRWLTACNGFFNTLVDRVVPGYPKVDATALERDLGYRDRLMVMGELFHSWIIEDPDGRTAELPLDRAGLAVKRVGDIGPYREQKVRILNGAHTAMVPAAMLAGLTTVGEMVEDAVFGPLTRRLLFDEVLPGVRVDETEKRNYAETVLVRFANPAIRHYLADIALNSVAKFTVRVYPSLVAYLQRHGELPPVLTFSLAALIRLYRPPGGSESAPGYRVRDREDVRNRFSSAWHNFARDRDYRRLVEAVVPVLRIEGGLPEGLIEGVASRLFQIEREGIRRAAGSLLA